MRHTGNGYAAKVPGTIIRELMSRMGHDSTRAALSYLHSESGADRVIADAMPVGPNVAGLNCDDQAPDGEDEKRC